MFSVESFLLTLKHSSRYITIIQKFNSPHLNNWFWNGTFEDDPWEDIVDQLADFKPTISAQLFAHHHTDSIKIFHSDNEPVSMALLVPGVSPMKSTLATETGANNPGVRLFKYDMNTGQVEQIDS